MTPNHRPGIFKRITWSILLVFHVLPSMWAQSRTAEAIARKEILELEEIWHSAYVKHDSSILEKILADEYISIGGNGQSASKKDAISGLVADSLSIYSYSTPYDIDIRLFGNNTVAIVLGRTKEKWRNRDNHLRGGYAEYRWTDNFVKRNARWQCISAQVVRVPNVSEPFEGVLDNLDKYLAACFRNNQFNGSVLIAKGGEILYKKGFGFSQFESRSANASDTKFRIGSTTKSFTSMMVLQLVEQGKLRLTDRLCDLLAAFPPDRFGKITVDQLLRHTSGFPDYNNQPDFFTDIQNYKLNQDEILKRVAGDDLLFEPGAKFGYSNNGYWLLGAIIEKVTGKSYEQNLKDRVFKPAGMNNSGYAHRSDMVEKTAKGYRQTLTGIESALYYRESPASGIYSTVEDLFLRDWWLYSEKLLSRSSKDFMWKLGSEGNPYGWRVSFDKLGGDSVKVVRTDGAVYGFFARTARIERDTFFVALATNVRGGTNYLPDIEKNIVRILYQQTSLLPRTSISFELLPVIESKGIQVAIEKYTDLKQNRADEFSFDENELNNLGYALLAREMLAQAIRIFQLNVTAFPNSANAYDSLGEGLIAAGNKQEAIKSYQKSLELNPTNANAAEMLKRLQAK